MSKALEDKPSRKNIVVVGGSYAGVTAAKSLAKSLNPAQYELIMLTSRPYYLHLISAIRMVVSDEDNLLERALVPYDRVHGVTHVVGTVTAIEDAGSGQGGVLVLKDGRRMSYAGLVLATGSTWSEYLHFPDEDAELQTAGEIKEAYPNTKVTLVHSRKLLINDTWPDKYRIAMERPVRDFGIEIISPDYVDTKIEPGVTSDITTRNGRMIKDVDLVVNAFGSKPNSAYIATLGPDVLTSAGTVKVKPTLELLNYPGIFATGDIVDWPEHKQAIKARAHAWVAAPNLLSFLKGAPQTKKYDGTFKAIVIPIGKYRGAGYFDWLWGIVLGNWLTSVLLGKSLMVNGARRTLGYWS